MRAIAAAFIVVLAVANAGGQSSPPEQAAPEAAAPEPQSTAVPYRRVGSMSELMTDLIYPTSNAIFYIQTRTPKTQIQWNQLRAEALTLAEAGNLLMMPGRARDQDKWIADAKLMLDAGTAAVAAVKAKDVKALAALNDQLYQSCTQCHMDYRPNYRRGRGEAPTGSAAPKSP